MLEIGTSGLMSGDGKRDDRPAVGTRARPRLYFDANHNKRRSLTPNEGGPIFGSVQRAFLPSWPRAAV